MTSFVLKVEIQYDLDKFFKGFLYYISLLTGIQTVFVKGFDA